MAIQRGLGKPFEPGNRHGKGRPAGSRNRATVAMEALLDGEGEDIMRKAIQLAKAGNEAALRLCLDRLVPRRRERSVRLRLPAIRTAQDIVLALEALFDGLRRGDVMISEAAQVANLLELQRKSIETAEFERRLTKVEAAPEE